MAKVTIGECRSSAKGNKKANPTSIQENISQDFLNKLYLVLCKTTLPFLPSLKDIHVSTCDFKFKDALILIFKCIQLPEIQAT